MPNPKTLFTYPYSTLSNYQNTFMHKSELRVNPTFITCANKVYEPSVGTITTHRSTGSLRIQL